MGKRGLGCCRSRDFARSRTPFLSARNTRRCARQAQRRSSALFPEEKEETPCHDLRLMRFLSRTNEEALPRLLVRSSRQKQSLWLSQSKRALPGHTQNSRSKQWYFHLL